MSEKIVLSKPKTLSSERYCFLDGKDLIVEFPHSKVIIKDCLDNTTQKSVASHKAFFDNPKDPEDLVAMEHKYHYEFDINNFVSLPINMFDVGAFNSQGSIGEDMFIVGKLVIKKASIEVFAVGYIYYLTYTMQKINNFIDNDIVIPLDFHSFYYLNNLFKKVTKTKLKSLLIYNTNEYTYLTNDEFDIFIEISKKGKCRDVLLSMLDDAHKLYVNMDFDNTKTCNRIQYSKTQDPAFKHLSKFLGDNIHYSSGLNVTKYYDESSHGVLYLNNKKGEM